MPFNRFSCLLLLILIVRSTPSFSQSAAPAFQRIDSLLKAKSSKPFNGVIIIAKEGKTLYENQNGSPVPGQKKLFKETDQFVIGSISKQITAVLVLRELDKKRLNLRDPIRKYLPELEMPWADTVTIHQLLTHTHGITALNEPLAYPAGTKFNYSTIGYQLLAKIVAKTSGKSFPELSDELFITCGMENTFDSNLKKHKRLVNGYIEKENGKLHLQTSPLKDFTPAATFISTARDLVLWNTALHLGKLLSPETYQLMITPYATRQHAFLGKTDYGYGPTITTTDRLLQIGQTGYIPGFVSMDYYFPKTKTSIIMLENTAWSLDDLSKTFSYHLQALKFLKEALLK
ncbi:CubicO group peptidase (beta-lactamase class C family) [Pedobacter cryoconitis]|uniref:CubicO group peptidase (Beta-lactamase class C family) n=1 Tax=Pedobacter cryoconitis TaxID=188932 RepID=A0A7W8ZJZ6_9SPHI|nr:serine hydrolase domain-containing protein [Pedobacter cryoconitis]MBB5635426.1 CubicO group peptidase (beta-lactamase class C family) [Pedobacter cryoconitis]